MIDNESHELILVGDVFSIVAEAGQIYRGYTNSDHGIDGEIEFKTTGKATGKVYLQLKSGDSYLTKRRRDGAEVFKSRTRATPITGSNTLTPSCWSSAPRTAKSAGWT